MLVGLDTLRFWVAETGFIALASALVTRYGQGAGRPEFPFRNEVTLKTTIRQRSCITAQRAALTLSEKNMHEIEVPRFQSTFADPLIVPFSTGPGA